MSDPLHDDISKLRDDIAAVADAGHRAFSQRKEAARAAHPSNRLYNGEARDLLEAVELHISCCAIERVADPGSDETAIALNRSLDESQGLATKAKSIYLRCLADAEAEAVRQMREAGIDDWAKCLESGDFSSMAI